MRFSLRWLFLITTYTAILTAGYVIGQSWPPGFWLSIFCCHTYFTHPPLARTRIPGSKSLSG